MQTESILLIGRNTGNAQEVFETHAARLRQRRAVDRVVVGTYDTEPVRELQDTLQGMSADTVYAVPMFFAHRHETTSGVPAVLSYVSGDVAYCEPPGNSPAITGVIQDRASNHVPPGPEQSLVLVGFGSNSRPYDRKTTEYHAARLREQSRYGEVVPCYLLQNPAVECVRYNVNGKRTVAVPLFFTRSAPTADTIPEKLELERGGIEYTAPLGPHPRVTDAIEAEIEKQRTLGPGDDTPGSTFEAQLTQAQNPVATDGEGLD